MLRRSHPYSISIQLSLRASTFVALEVLYPFGNSGPLFSHLGSSSRAVGVAVGGRWAPQGHRCLQNAVGCGAWGVRPVLRVQNGVRPAGLRIQDTVRAVRVLHVGLRLSGLSVKAVIRVRARRWPSGPRPRQPPSSARLGFKRNSVSRVFRCPREAGFKHSGRVPPGAGEFFLQPPAGETEYFGRNIATADADRIFPRTDPRKRSWCTIPVFLPAGRARCARGPSSIIIYSPGEEVSLPRMSEARAECRLN